MNNVLDPGVHDYLAHQEVYERLSDLGSTHRLTERHGPTAEFGTDEQRAALERRLGDAAEGLDGFDTSSVDPELARAVDAAVSALQDAARAVGDSSGSAANAVYEAEVALAAMHQAFRSRWDRTPRAAATSDGAGSSPPGGPGRLSRLALPMAAVAAGLGGLVGGAVTLADDARPATTPAVDTPAGEELSGQEPTSEVSGTGEAVLEAPPPPAGIQVDTATGDVSVTLRRTDGGVTLEGEAELAGGLTVDNPPCEADGVSRHAIQGQVDRATGDVQGATDHASIQEVPAGQDPICDELAGSVETVESVTGTVDRATGQVTLEATGEAIDGVAPVTEFRAQLPPEQVADVLDGPEEQATDDGPDEGGADEGVGVGLVLGGLAAMAAGAGVAGRRLGAGSRVHGLGGTGPCADLRAEWEQAQADADQRREAADDAEQACDEAEALADRIRSDRDRLCEEWPPACWERDPAETSAEDVGAPETREDRWDLFVRAQHARDRWAAYERGEISAEEAGRARDDVPSPDAIADIEQRNDGARAHREQLERDMETAEDERAEACRSAEQASADAAQAHARADRAARRYQACLDSEAERETDGADGTGTGPASDRGRGAHESAPGAATGPAAGTPCAEGERRDPVVIATYEDRQMLVDVSVNVVQEGGRALEPHEGKRIANGFRQVSGVAGGVGDVLTARGIGRSVLSGDRAAAAARTGAAGAGVPTSLPALGARYVQHTAGAVAEITDAVTRWASGQNTYTVYVVRHLRSVRACLVEHWECVDGAWKCRRDVELEYGEITAQQYRGRTGVTVGELAREVQSWLVRYKAIAASDFADVEAWVSAHPPGECT